MDDLVKQIVNQFLFLSAGSAALTKLKELLRKPEEIPSSLAESLPAQATFFICYIMLRSFTGFSLELLRVVDLIIIPIKRKWFCYTPREDEAAWRPPYRSIGEYQAQPRSQSLLPGLWAWRSSQGEGPGNVVVSSAVQTCWFVLFFSIS